MINLDQHFSYIPTIILQLKLFVITFFDRIYISFNFHIFTSVDTILNCQIIYFDETHSTLRTTQNHRLPSEIFWKNHILVKNTIGKNNFFERGKIFFRDGPDKKKTNHCWRKIFFPPGVVLFSIWERTLGKILQFFCLPF